MGIIELIFLAMGLAMDSFAVSVCKGLSHKKVGIKEVLICGLWFGGFQGMMPFIGYLLGTSFERYIVLIAPWIAFVLLFLIGVNMIKEAMEEEENVSSSMKVGTMLMLALATSIDALAVGITFVCVPVDIINGSCMKNTVMSCVFISIVTMMISMFGVKIGNVFGTRYRRKAEMSGGVILILIGLKILAEHLFF